MVWSSLFFVLTNKNIRAKFFCLKENKESTTHQGTTHQVENYILNIVYNRFFFLNSQLVISNSAKNIKMNKYCS